MKGKMLIHLVEKMQIIDLKLKDIIPNLKSNKKRIVRVFVICICVGILVGIFNVMNYNTQKEQAVQKINAEITFDEIEQDSAYYMNAIKLINRNVDYLTMYLNYFTQVKLTENSRIELDKITKDVEQYQTWLQDVNMFFENEIVVLPENVNSLKEDCEQRIIKLNSDIIETENECSYVVEGNFTENYKEKKQDETVDAIKSIKKEIEYYESKVELCDTVTDEKLYVNVETAEGLLEESLKNLNTLISKYNTTLEKIAETENYELIYNKKIIDTYRQEVGIENEIDYEAAMNNKRYQAIVYARSVEGVDVPKERFFATITFFILFGFAVSLVIGICPKRFFEKRK